MRERETMLEVDAGQRVAARIVLKGRVQGVGLRPALARWSRACRLHGFVRNTSEGAEIVVEGSAGNLARFKRSLLHQLPRGSRVAELRENNTQPTGCTGFRILETDASGPPSAAVPLDVAICGDCLAEVTDAGNRRFAYPFTSCARCGPRYTVIERMPYDRDATTLREFPLCPECAREFASLEDRRLHAESIACPRCGPHVWLNDDSQRVLARGDEAIAGVASALRAGKTVALCGLGGYQLLVDATNEEAVRRLRQRKQRPSKPLAVMAASLEEAEKLAFLGAAERRALGGEAGVIVVVPRRSTTPIASSVAAGLNTIGLMLPTTALHLLVLRAIGRPIVATSGNREGEPMAFTPAQAQAALGGVADLWLHHNRRIAAPLDDSVVRVMAGRPVTFRLARGLAPLSLPLPSDEHVIALGGQQKSAIALVNGGQTVLGPHVGDLDRLAARERFVSQLDWLATLYGCQPCCYVHDGHPDYFTSIWAEGRRQPKLAVQHHYAHVVAGMLERGWLDRTVLGVAFDGAGYGTDGTIWGGEFLVATLRGFRRAGHLLPLPLPGGELAIREPWRVAVAAVNLATNSQAAESLRFPGISANQTATILRASKSNRLTPITTSMGRLFDVAAVLVLELTHAEFEGQAAMLLESACDPTAEGEYPFSTNKEGVVDWRPALASLLLDRDSGMTQPVMAMRFHRGVARLVFEFAKRHERLPIVLGGGVFQNRILVELINDFFSQSRQPLGLPGAIPPNDGGLAAGQLAVALARRDAPCA
jgi:hydrogenase maturation protein HypF